MRKALVIAFAILALTSCSARYKTAEDILAKYEASLSISEITSISAYSDSRGLATFYWSSFRPDSETGYVSQLNGNSFRIFAYKDCRGWYVDDGRLSVYEYSDGIKTSKTEFLSESKVDAMIASGEIQRLLKGER